MGAGYRSAALALALALAGCDVAWAQDGGAAAGGPGPIGTADLAGATIDAIDISVTGTTDPEAARVLEQEALKRLHITEGDQWNSLLVEQAIEAIGSLADVASVKWRIDREVAPQRNRLSVMIEAGPGKAGAKPARFPVLHRGERSYLRVLLNGGFGLLSDGNPWFRNPATFTRNNPLVENPAIGADTGRRASWTEAYFEYGLGGVMPLGESDFYVYGAATATTAASVGRDIFRDDARSTTAFEKLYAGLLYAPETGSRVSLSVGRQNFTLNDGFLIAQYGSQYNAGPRPGIYIAPRTTHDMSALLTVKSGQWVWTSFFLNPNEFEPIESNTKLAGTNLRYSFSKSAFFDVSYINIVDSDARIAVPDGPARDRDGVQTIAGHLRWANAAVLPGIWFDSEIAHQWHDEYAMNAWAGYILVGYLARQTPWTPSISYRFSGHSGDDPTTDRFERFDPLFTGGLGEWLQGITLNKVLNPANRKSHRIRANIAPNARLNLTLDVFIHRADELNNRGGNFALAQLASHDLGQEFQFVTRWAISPRVYFVGVASLALPGEAISAATGKRARPWTSLQAQFYFNF